jgi:hypothetical protein
MSTVAAMILSLKEEVKRSRTTSRFNSLALSLSDDKKGAEIFTPV